MKHSDELTRLRAALASIADANVVKFQGRSFGKDEPQWRAFAIALQDCAREALREEHDSD